MASTFWGLGIGTSGLFANQAKLNTTGHNIANSETKGYSLQIANQVAGTPISTHNTAGMAGTGVIITSVTQIRNEYFDSKYRENNALLGEYSTKSQYMDQIQNYFNELEDNGYTTNFNSFFDALQELSKDPSNATVRNQVIQYGKTFTEYFNSLSTSLNSVQEDLNFEVKNQVDKINSIAQQIATLNQQINRVEINGQNANDLRDQRNLLVDNLSEIANISVVEQESQNGTGVSKFYVYLDGNVLVDSSTYNTLKVVPRDEKVNQNDIDGIYDIEWSTGQAFNVNSNTLTGSLKAVIDMRDGNNNENLKGTANGTAGTKTVTLTGTNINDINKLNIPQSGTITIGNKDYTYSSFTIKQGTDGNYEYTFNLDEALSADATDAQAKLGESVDYKGIPYYMGKLNEFVRTFASAFNEIHKQGVDLDGNTALDFFNGVDPTTGKNYVLSTNPETSDDVATTTIEASYYYITAGNFTVTSEIENDPNKLSTTADISAGVEKSDIVDKLIALKNDKSMFKQGSPSQFLQTLVAEIGVDTSTANNFEKSQTNILNSITNQRLSVSGVDTDEEAMNLIKYQQGYNLCSKVISVMDEVLDKLINGTAV